MDWRLLIGDALVLSGVVAMTVALLGLLRFRDPYLKIHAAAKAVIVGVLLVLVAAAPANDGALLARAALVAALLLLTSPVSAHALARLERRRRRDQDRAGRP